jgi:hypothetical protein
MRSVGQARFALTVALSIPTIVVAQDAPPGASGSTLEGDVYVMKSRDTTKLAGRVVALIHDSEAFRVELRLACDRWSVDVMPFASWILAAQDSVADRKVSEPAKQSIRARLVGSSARLADARTRVLSGVERVVLGAVVDTTRTDRTGRYRFRDVGAGLYVVWTEWMFDGRRHRWWEPVSVGVSTTVTRDLENAAVGDAGSPCVLNR